MNCKGCGQPYDGLYCEACLSDVMVLLKASLEQAQARRLDAAWELRNRAFEARTEREIK